MSTNGGTKDGNLRYEYDDHYFMTDPEEFIYEFFPNDGKRGRGKECTANIITFPIVAEWQLLPRPVTLKQFENLPFVRSLFFRYGLRFTDNKLPAVIEVC